MSPCSVAVHGSAASFASPLVWTVTVPSAAVLHRDDPVGDEAVVVDRACGSVITMPSVTSETAIGVTMVTSPGLISGAMLPVSMVMVR